MEMSIDDAIHDTEVMKEYLECRGESRSEGLGVAIETMRKYQKIQEIINDFREYQHPLYLTEFYKKICEVIEDGKID